MLGYRVRRSRVALFVCLAFLTSLCISPYAASQDPPSAAAPLRLAVGECSDATYGTIPGLAKLLEQALWRSLSGQPGVELVAPGVEQPDRVVSARLTNVTKPRRGRGATVQVLAEATDPETGKAAYRTTVTGGGFRRPGEDLVGQVERAIFAAADQIAAQVVRAERLGGVVTKVEGDVSATIDRGADDGLATGTELEIARDGQAIGKLRIDRVDKNKASGRLLDVAAGQEVRVGDQVRIVSSLAPVLEPTPPPAKKKGGRNWLPWVIGGLVLGAVVVLFASGGGGNNVPGGDLYAVAANQRIPADGVSATMITANLRDARGNPAPNRTPIRFRTSLGVIAPAKVPLQNGKAEAILTSASNPGTATITVLGGGLTATLTVQFTPTATSDVAANLYVTANPEQVPADGESTARITAVVTDEDNVPVPNGTLLSFGTSLGVIEPGNTTTANGVAEATLRSGDDAGEAVVTVRVGALTERANVEFVAPGTGGQRTLYVTAAKPQIVADGVSTVAITASAKTATGNPVADGNLIRFQTTLGTIFPATATTSNGAATATLRSDETPGTARVTASLAQLQANTQVVFVAQGMDVASIFLTRDPAEIEGDGISTSRITATVRGSNNNPVPDDTMVVFTTTRGIATPGIAYTSNGTAETTLRSEPTSVDLTATVTAVAGGQQATTTVRFIGTGAGPSRITLVADLTNIPADGASTAKLRGTLVRIDGTPARDKQIIFDTTAGRLRLVGGTGWATRVTTTTDAQGAAEVLLRSTSTPDTAAVTVSAPTVTTETASITVSFSSLVISSVVADPTNVAVGGAQTSKVTATVVDTAGNPAPDGTVVGFSIVNQTQLSSASIARSAATTGGKAVALFRSGVEVGTAQIRAEIPSANATNDQTLITITAGPPAYVSATADKFVTSARAIGQSSSVTITALVSDKYNNPVQDGTAVRFEVSPGGGAVVTGSATTSGGFATATMYATGWVGDAEVVASTTGEGGVRVDNSARPVVVHMAGAPVAVAIISPDASGYSAASPLQLYTDSDQGLTIKLEDSSGGPADPNAEVTFQVTRGRVTPDPARITSPLAGTATATFRTDQPTPTGDVDTIVAVSEGVNSPPLYIFVEEKPTPP